MRGPRFSFLESKLRAEGHGNLLFHKVYAIAGFGDAVFHLQAGVHFDEEGVSLRRDKEFDSGERIIADFPDQHSGIFLEPFAQLRSDA